MNYLIPVNNLLNQNNDILVEMRKETFENILTQQILISQLSKGISFRDTEDMDEYERVFILKKLMALKKEELEARQEALKSTRK